MKSLVISIVALVVSVLLFYSIKSTDVLTTSTELLSTGTCVVQRYALDHDNKKNADLEDWEKPRKTTVYKILGLGKKHYKAVYLDYFLQTYNPIYQSFDFKKDPLVTVHCTPELENYTE